MDTKDILFAISGILFGLGFVPYVWAIFRHGVRPEKTSWLIWTVLDGIALAGMYAEGTANFQIIVATFGAGIVLLLALWKGGVAVWTNLEKFCIVGAAIGILVWQLSGNPTWGIVISGAVAVIGSWPTFISALEEPDKQGKLGWTMFFISCLFGVSAIKALTFADATQPIVFLLVESVMMYLIFLHKRKRVHA